MTKQVEAKVKTGSGAAAVTGFALWLLGTYVFDDAVPTPVAALVSFVVPAVVTFATAWLTRHTPRVDDTEAR